MGNFLEDFGGVQANDIHHSNFSNDDLKSNKENQPHLGGNNTEKVRKAKLDIS